MLQRSTGISNYGVSAPLKEIPLISILKLLCYKVVDILMRVVKNEEI
jgi:hypothetical protein